ncbi:udp-glucuronate 4-epimerase 4 [Quercus suber]|uniref:Udp-glucuronate 4-epimerase 4 n=1 Tax=Quercus suber TaxID=58331 RepID=A0AAW0JVM1_QUESU
MGIGVVVRDHFGVVRAALSRKFHGLLGPLATKTKAMEEGLQFALDHGVNATICEGDSMVVFNSLTGSIFPPASISNLISGSLLHAARFDVCKFSVVPRNGNRVAHGLGQYAKNLSDSCTWIGDIPPFLDQSVSRDQAAIDRGGDYLFIEAAGFVVIYVFSALKWREDSVVGIDNFNEFYDPTLKRTRQALLEYSGVLIVEGDINDMMLLKKLFELMTFTHVLHLAAQAGVRYAMENPLSYVHSNLAGFVNLFEVCKSVNPQSAILWDSSSLVYGLNTKVPLSGRSNILANRE